MAHLVKVKLGRLNRYDHGKNGREGQQSEQDLPERINADHEANAQASAITLRMVHPACGG